MCENKAKARGNEMKAILNYESLLTEEYKPSSAMKVEYRAPKSYGLDRKDIPKRRALFHEQVVAEMTEEIYRERSIPDPIEDYCSTYDDLFRIPGFKVDDSTPENTDLYLKHPLYTSVPITVWTDTLSKDPKNMVKLPGMTRIIDPMNPFRKYGYFTTPLDKRTREPES